MHHGRLSLEPGIWRMPLRIAPWKRQVKIKERSFTDSKPSVRAALSAFIQVQEGFARLHNPSQIPI